MERYIHGHVLMRIQNESKDKWATKVSANEGDTVEEKEEEREQEIERNIQR